VFEKLLVNSSDGTRIPEQRTFPTPLLDKEGIMYYIPFPMSHPPTYLAYHSDTQHDHMSCVPLQWIIPCIPCIPHISFRRLNLLSYHAWYCTESPTHTCIALVCKQCMCVCGWFGMICVECRVWFTVMVHKTCGHVECRNGMLGMRVGDSWEMECNTLCLPCPIGV